MYVSLLTPDSGTLSFSIESKSIKKDREDLSGEKDAQLTPQPSPPNP